MMSTPCCAMEVMMGIVPLPLRLEQIFHQYVLKAICLDRSTVLMGFHELHRLRPDHTQVREFARILALDIPTLPLRYPFDQPYDSLIYHPQVDVTLFERYHQLTPESRPFLARSLFRSLLPLGEEFVSIFTDGSVTDFSAGLGIYGPSGLRTHHQLTSPASVFTTEIRAILEGLKIVQAMEDLPLRVRMYTDSWSSLQVLSNPRITVHTHPAVAACKQILHQLENRGSNVVLSWVPSHVGITGNETADSLAGLGAQQDTTSLPPLIGYREYFPLIKRWLRQQWQQIWNEEDRGRHAHSIFPEAKTKPWFSGLKLNRSQIVFFNRVATSHTRTNAHLARFDIVPSRMCECEEDYETPDHLVWACPNINRQNLTQNLEPSMVGRPLRDLIATDRWKELCLIADFCKEMKVPI